MPEFSLNEGMVEVWNFAPKILDREVVKLAGVMRASIGQQDFRIEWAWSTGPERQLLVLEPQACRSMPMSVALDCERDLGHRGIGAIRPGEDKLRRAIESVQRAVEFFASVGSLDIMQLRARMRWTESDERVMKQEFAGQYINAVREGLLRKELERLQFLELERDEKAAGQIPEAVAVV